MTWTLAESYARCAELTRRARSSFPLMFWGLPTAERRAMTVLYAFLRRTDDLGDADEPAPVRREALSRWRRSFDRALAGEFESPLLPALVDVVVRYAIPPEHLTAVIDGVEMDLEPRRYATFAELEVYCHRVASVVGLACLQIWGFDGPAAFEPARRCGTAFQLTNILRDLSEDAARDRVYLPVEDLERFSYGESDLKAGVADARFQALAAFEIRRAERLFEEAAHLEPHLAPAARPTFRALFEVYRELLRTIAADPTRALRERIRVGRWRRLQIAARGLALGWWEQRRTARPSGSAP